MAITPTNPLAWKKLLLLVAPEDTSGYGIDAAPIGADAFLATNVTLKPLQNTKLKRQFIAPYFGNRPSVLTQQRTELTAKIELAGPLAAANGIPAYDAILRACARSRTQIAATAAATIAAAPVAGVGATGTFTFAPTTAYGGSFNNTVTLTCTTAGGSGLARFTVAAPATEYVPAYNQAGVLMTTAQPFALPGGAVITPTVGTAFIVGDSYTIPVQAAGVQYTPSSNRNTHASCSIYFLVEGERHRMIGTRGTAKLNFNVNSYPELEIAMTGFFETPDSVIPPVPVFTDWTDPLAVSTTNTPICRLFGNDLVMEQSTFDLATSYALTERVGRRAVRIGDFAPRWTATCEAPDIATFNVFAAAAARSYGALKFQHGTTPGEIIAVDAPRVQLDAPTQSQSQDDYMHQLGADVLFNAGDDDSVITIK